MRFAYADPPYLGQGASMYGYPEWDEEETHLLLIDRLVQGFPDGWALSCNPRDLRWLLPAAPRDARVCAWTKSYARIRPTSVQFMWEPVIFRGGRKVLGRKPLIRDWYTSRASQGWGIQGSKPPGFCRWVLDMLGYDADEDELVDLYPGSGIMGAVAAQGVLT